MSKFKISFRVDAKHLGEILAAVHGHVSDLDVALIEGIAHTKNRKRGSSRDAMLEVLKDQPNKSMTLKDARKLFEQHEIPPDLVYAAKDALLKKGLIEYKNGVMRLKQ